uniref:Uncharacterized protein n=1 Tax=Anguilla anguilla TaxID=7936 RepID=A0A0E9X190_ANGAN
MFPFEELLRELQLQGRIEWPNTFAKGILHYKSDGWRLLLHDAQCASRAGYMVSMDQTHCFLHGPQKENWLSIEKIFLQLDIEQTVCMG